MIHILFETLDQSSMFFTFCFERKFYCNCFDVVVFASI